MADTLSPVDYSALFRALPGSYLLLAPDGTVLNNSDQHVEASLLPRSQAVGRNLFEAYPSAPGSQRDLAASLEQVQRTLRPDTMPLDLERPAAQGGGIEERYWQLTHYPMLHPDGTLQYILQIPQDVTGTYRAAQALDEARQRTQFIMESLPVLVWTNRPDGTSDYFNNRWLEFTGKTEEQMLAIDWNEITHPDDRPGLVRGWAKALADGVPLQYEYRLLRHDGQYRWVLIRNSPRRDADGRITMWVGAASDIHEQRLMVQELLTSNEQQAALADQAYATYRQAESQREAYHSLFTQAPVAIGILRGPGHRHEFVPPPTSKFSMTDRCWIAPWPKPCQKLPSRDLLTCSTTCTRPAKPTTATKYPCTYPAIRLFLTLIRPTNGSAKMASRPASWFSPSR